MIPLKWCAAIIAAGLVVIPFATLKGSSYEFKLRLYRGDRDMREVFASHYSSG